ncbi:MAG: hypothetical protein AAFO95_09520 [Cyanobacteria bacterium J06600_6]
MSTSLQSPSCLGWKTIINLGNLWHEAGGFVVLDSRIVDLDKKMQIEQEVIQNGENPRQ